MTQSPQRKVNENDSALSMLKSQNRLLTKVVYFISIFKLSTAILDTERDRNIVSCAFRRLVIKQISSNSWNGKKRNSSRKCFIIHNRTLLGLTTLLWCDLCTYRTITAFSIHFTLYSIQQSPGQLVHNVPIISS